MKYEAIVSFELSVPVEFESSHFIRNELDKQAKEVAQELIDELGYKFFNVDGGYIVNIRRV